MSSKLVFLAIEKTSASVLYLSYDTQSDEEMTTEVREFREAYAILEFKVN